MVARIKAVLRRSLWQENKDTVFKEGLLMVDMEKHMVEVDHKPVTLSPKEFDLLVHLLRHRGKVLNRAGISETVWGQEYFGHTRTVDVHVGRLRKKLGKAGDAIQTVERLGYRYEQRAELS
jgi:two-component system alkaline phosphatase synthesis response regulator PhoP